MLPEVVIVGQVNTGKSTLFNRLCGKRQAIEHHTPGVTRDRLYADIQSDYGSFTIVDTGGLLAGDIFEGDVTENVQASLLKAKLIIFLIDARQGITSVDQFVANLVRMSGKPYLLVANKVDPQTQDGLAYSSYELGMGEPVAISAAHGVGIGNLTEQICLKLKLKPSSLATTPDLLSAQNNMGSTIKVTILGRPNVGKSTLVNALLGKERAIVSKHAGTTRDATDTEHVVDGQKYVLIDTAGLRHKARVTDDIEYYSTTRTLESLKRADIAVLLLDATATISEQDQRIAGFIEESGCGCIIVVNKWDLIPEKDEHTILVYEDEILGRLKFIRHVPFLFISAKTKQRVTNLYEIIQHVYKNTQKKLQTSELNKCLADAQLKKPAPSFKGRRLRIYYATQTGNKPFIITLFVNNPELVHFSYKRYLENRLREQFAIDGVPIRIVFRKKS